MYTYIKKETECWIQTEHELCLEGRIIGKKAWELIDYKTWDFAPLPLPFAARDFFQNRPRIPDHVNPVGQPRKQPNCYRNKKGIRLNS